MSSETGSSISRFGLYRTIDARTEEFLKLSKKRQLRQGCFCAAVSTAVTVIVVITIILIYEYSNVSTTNIQSRWYGVMNESIDALPFDASHKTKIKLDRTTIQLLPILLKAFSKSKYFDDNDESPSSTPLPETETEVLYNNVFTDTRNWMKMPTSRLYAIEFKTSPIVYFKNPTRNIDYFRKIRKTRDYERIMNYVDKMISEKVTGSTQSMIKNGYTIFDNSLMNQFTTPKAKDVINKNVVNKNHAIHSAKQLNCYCCAKISIFLKKLISSIQKLIPEVLNSRSKLNDNCIEKNMNIVTETNTVLSTPYLLNTMKLPKDERNISLQSTKLLSRKTINNMINNNKDFKNITKPYPQLSKILNLLKHNIIQSKDGQITEMHPISKPEDNKNNVKNILDRAVIKSFEDSDLNIGDKTNIQPLKKMHRLYTKTPTINIDNNRIEENSRDFVETSTKLEKSIHFLDAHSLEPIKIKYNSTKPDINYIMTKLKNNTKGSYKIVNYTFSTEHTHVNYDILDISNEFVTNPINTITENETEKVKILNLGGNSTDSVVETTFYSVEESIKNKPIIIKNNTLKYYESHRDDTVGQENDNIEEEIERRNLDLYDENNTLKELEDALSNLNSNVANADNSRTIMGKELNHWDLMKIEEHAKNLSKFIISHNRPTYLEMQRNDWKDEEKNNVIDYDVNINNYIFE